MKARMRSIYDALDLIKQKAQDTALTYNSIIISPIVVFFVLLVLHSDFYILQLSLIHI